MLAMPRTPSQRPAILGQLPRITRADGSPIRVLLVDDEPALTNLLKMALHYEGWQIEVAGDGKEAVAKYHEFGPDLLVLDIMLPDIDGLQILKMIRESEGYTPTLFLTARDSVLDRVNGLTAGADDYLTKPFSAKELVARVGAVLRRSEHPEEAITSSFECGELQINFASRTVRMRGKQVSLTRTEFELLRQLALNVNRVLLHRDLLTAVWGPEYRDDIDYLRAYIRYLRRKLEEDPSHPRYILTSTGVGYMLANPEEGCD
jgi:two-component system response regulator TrcR